jgi:hypothetical protein
MMYCRTVSMEGTEGEGWAWKTYVVPVSLSLLQSLSLELEASDPSTGLLGVLGKGKLTLVAVP